MSRRITERQAAALGIKVPPKRERPADGMNRTERAYWSELLLAQDVGTLLWTAREPIKLRLAGNTFYTPDFFVRPTDDRLVAIEVKGFMRDDAAVKIKVAATMYPWIEFYVVKRGRDRRGVMWIYRRVTAHGGIGQPCAAPF